MNALHRERREEALKTPGGAGGTGVGLANPAAAARTVRVRITGLREGGPTH